MTLKMEDYLKVDVLRPTSNVKKQTAPEDRQGFYLAQDVDVHAIRRVQMLHKYPHIKDLFGTDIRVGLGVTFTAILQTFLAVIFRDASWPVFLAAAYILGASLCASLHLGLHEICHNLAHRTPAVNRMFELVLNLPMVIPFAATYKVYHLDHHRYQGVEQVDPDLPEWIEAWVVSNQKYPRLAHAAGKLMFLLSNLALYGIRPVLVRPENVQIAQKTGGIWYVMNHVCQVVYTYAMYHFFGANAVLYLFLSLYLTCIHPTAGHFIGEHYVFDNDTDNYQLDHPVETRSYYGKVWNWLLYNGGYHIEHHDFPAIPYTRIAELHDIAPEYYSDPAQRCDSWSKLLIRFIFDDSVTLWARVKRPSLHHHKVNPSQQMIDFQEKISKQQ